MFAALHSGHGNGCMITTITFHCALLKPAAIGNVVQIGLPIKFLSLVKMKFNVALMIIYDLFN